MPNPGHRNRLLRGSLRLRITTAAVAVVGVILVLVGLTLMTGLRWSLSADLESTARVHARDVAHLLADGIPAGGLATGDPEDLFVQVVDDTGAVVASSANVRGIPPVASPAPGETTVIDDPPVDDDPFVVVAVAADTPDGPVTVLVGRTLERVAETTGALARALLAGFPVVLALLGLSSWQIVGRALAPVEAMRAEVDTITAADLSRRLPDPPSREIGRLADTMNGMLGRLESAQRRQRRFVSDASHELRSPVAALSQHAAVALRHPDRTTLRELAEVVSSESARMERLVADMLWLVRSDEGAPQPVRVPLDLDDLVADEARTHAAADVRIETGGVSAGQVMGDAAQLRHVLRNLVDNAVRHARSRVALSLREEGDEVVLHVDDDGPGIPPADRERVLERFVRLDPARGRDEGGSGLGLAIVAEIAAAHDGTVTVGESTLGGARIELRLPAWSTPADPPRSASVQHPGRTVGITADIDTEA